MLVNASREWHPRKNWVLALMVPSHCFLQFSKLMKSVTDVFAQKKFSLKRSSQKTFSILKFVDTINKYSGTRLVRTPRGHAILSGLSEKTSGTSVLSSVLKTKADSFTRKRCLIC